MKINYVGMLRSPVGYARVGRGLVKALAGLGHEVKATEQIEANYEKDFPLEEELASVIGKGKKGLTVAFIHPSGWKSLSGKMKVGIVEYDTSHLPAAWINQVKQLDFLITPSEFCRELLVGAGVSAQNVEVMPFGYDPQVIYPADRKEDRPLTFLHVAGPHLRKSTGGVIQAFQVAFEDVDDVRLIIKTTPRSMRRETKKPIPPRAFYTTMPAAELIKTYAADDRRITLIEKTLSDAQMGDLYRQADVYVQPSLAEGFSLATLEAMATGLAPIVTGWGGHLDYCFRDNSYHLAYSIIPALDQQYDMEGDPSWPRGVMSRPDYDHLADTMRLAYDRADILSQKVVKARELTAAMTWQSSAETLLNILGARGYKVD